MEDMSGRTEDRRKTAPFLLKLFFRTGAFHRPDEFASHSLPPHVGIHTWPTATFEELSYHLAASEEQLLPSPCIGTRLAFRLVCRDANAHSTHRFVVKDLGSLVLGERGPGAAADEAVASTREGSGGGFQDEEDAPRTALRAEPDSIAHKTLADAKFIVGDYISCAILPPLDDGSVAPADSARSGRGSGVGEARPVGPGPAWDDAPVPRRPGRGGPGMNDRHGGSGGAWASRRNDPRPADFASRGGRSFGASMPEGEWRRGERLPDVPGGGGRGPRPRYRGR